MMNLLPKYLNVDVCHVSKICIILLFVNNEREREKKREREREREINLILLKITKFILCYFIPGRKTINTITTIFFNYKQTSFFISQKKYK